MHASPNYVYARDSINAVLRGRSDRDCSYWSVIGPRIGKHTVALIRTFPSLTYLPFAFIEHIFRIVCLANLICDQPYLSVTRHFSSSVSAFQPRSRRKDQISSVTFPSSRSFAFLRSLSVHVSAKISLSFLFSFFFPLLFFSMALFQRIYTPAPSIHQSIHIYIHIYYMRVYIENIYLYIYASRRIFSIPKLTRIYIRVCVYIYTRVYIYVHIRVYIYTFIAQYKLCIRLTKYCCHYYYCCYFCIINITITVIH